MLTRASHLVQVEHLQIWTARPFAEVVRALEAEAGGFDGALIHARIEAKAAPSSVLEAIAAMAGRSGLMRFAALDHGAILRLQGKPTDAVRFLIGDPLTASRMTRLRIASALYAPLSLLVAVHEPAGTPLHSDPPSPLFLQLLAPVV